MLFFDVISPIALPIYECSTARFGVSHTSRFNYLMVILCSLSLTFPFCLNCNPISFETRKWLCIVSFSDGHLCVTSGNEWEPSANHYEFRSLARAHLSHRIMLRDLAFTAFQGVHQKRFSLCADLVD